MKTLNVYTDGSCKSLCWQPKIKDSPIGFACAYAVGEDVILSLSGSKAYGDSYQAELEAVRLALSNIPKDIPAPYNIVLHSDCRGVVTLLNEGGVKNDEIKSRLEALKENGVSVSAKWVRGHSGNKLNNYVHKLSYIACSAEISRFEKELPRPTKSELKALSKIVKAWVSDPGKARKKEVTKLTHDVAVSNSVAGRLISSFRDEPQEWTITDMIGSARRALRDEIKRLGVPLILANLADKPKQNAPQTPEADEPSIEDNPHPAP